MMCWCSFVLQGERLSHAVGCAFAICLEKKQKREKEAVSVQFNDKGTSFARTGSFRQATLTERLADPQSVITAGSDSCAEPTPRARSALHGWSGRARVHEGLVLDRQAVKLGSLTSPIFGGQRRTQFFAHGSQSCVPTVALVQEFICRCTKW